MTNQEAIIELKDLKDYCHSTFLKRTCEAYTQAINKAIETLENQSSVIEELEKIKAEIEKLNNTDYGSMFSYESHKGAGDMQDDIINIIERDISELKGETK